MTNITKNALRIAELRGCEILNNYPDYNIEDYETIEFFSSYNGLMPMVWECNQSEDYLITITRTSIIMSELHTTKSIPERDSSYRIKTSENSFIEALQLAVIKYLELKGKSK